jgi:hypothetical protein
LPSSRNMDHPASVVWFLIRLGKSSSLLRDGRSFSGNGGGRSGRERFFER